MPLRVEVVRKYKKALVVGLLSVLGLFFVCIAVTSPMYYKVGNVFFGGVPKLYNVNLAQHFFRFAAYPQIGEAVPYAHHQLSRTYFIQGELETALAEVLKELMIHPDSFGTYYILGLTYAYMNQEEDAIAAFSKYIDVFPDTWAPRNDKAWLQFRIGDIEGALTTIEPVAVHTANPWIQNTYGTILLNLGEKEKARIAFDNAKKAVENMTEEQWGRAYPGNDPRIYDVGLSAMKTSIESNYKKLDEL